MADAPPSGAGEDLCSVVIEVVPDLLSSCANFFRRDFEIYAGNSGKVPKNFGDSFNLAQNLFGGAMLVY